MQKESRSLAHLRDAQLILEVKTLAAGERNATARLVASLAELDVRRLYLGEGFSSLFTYCTQCLHLSEHAAYNRIEAARIVQKWPAILERLSDGLLTLTTVSLLARHLTEENHRALLDAARHKTKREVEQIVAALHPRPDVRATIRKLPAPQMSSAQDQTPSDGPHPAAGAPPPSSSLTTSPSAPAVVRSIPTEAPRPVAAASVASAASRPAVVAPLAPERYKVQFTVSVETHDKLRRAQDLLRHSVPNGNPAEIFDRAITLLVAQLEKTRLAATTRPRPPREAGTRSRHIPASVKRTVWARDAGRCGFVGSEGRCAERGFLEYHHVTPYADGGAATDDNIQLRCRSHNQYDAERMFGPTIVSEFTGA